MHETDFCFFGIACLNDVYPYSTFVPEADFVLVLRMKQILFKLFIKCDINIGIIINNNNKH